MFPAIANLLAAFWMLCSPPASPSLIRPYMLTRSLAAMVMAGDGAYGKNVGEVATKVLLIHFLPRILC